LHGKLRDTPHGHVITGKQSITKHHAPLETVPQLVQRVDDVVSLVAKLQLLQHELKLPQARQAAAVNYAEEARDELQLVPGTVAHDQLRDKVQLATRQLPTRHQLLHPLLRATDGVLQ
jgi:uncharacterized membrane protein YccC